MPTKYRPAFMPGSARTRVLCALALLLVVLACKVLLFGGVAIMTITPSRIDRCLSESTAVTARWWSLGRGDVRLWTYSPGEPPEIWMDGSRIGEARTSRNRMVEGRTIMLTDQDGNVLARNTVTATDCRSMAVVAP